MTIHNKIRDGKLPYDIYRKATKILTLLSGQVEKYKYVTGEEILLWINVKLEKKLIYIFSFRKSFRKTNKETSWYFKILKPFIKIVELYQIKSIFA